ncbi:MAG: 2-C-methyl-D-erythritol 4-phosphate cytidylyltransferase [Pseudobutyrivibrio sp.]|uniref:IspD/TarI family cytidylyltransferase n=1 Tax=Pseudobutyrivibrio sp. TaxID=2014367 RepID=UPI0025E0791F|nr:IspD/TarI family cytidylyltransferase [Pseudobutyrivibrio sp.]MBQ6463540.1 2-C-methyl-D-erythritol 4-phosphate cytidylyltransferase [Pseudobutyrivibrio sp.]
MNVVMILAGGVGSRVGADRPKQFIEIGGKPILAYTIDIFEQNNRIDCIEIVCHHKWLVYCKNMIRKYGFSKIKWVVEGGNTFQKSVINGINHLLQEGICDDDFVYIQYGAAPFTSQKIVNSVIDMTEKKGMAVTATPCYQLISKRTTDDSSCEYCNRDEFIQIACPYGFRFEYLVDIYNRGRKNELLDIVDPHTTSLMYALGDTVFYTYGEQSNIKITTKEDVELFEHFVNGLNV